MGGTTTMFSLLEGLVLRPLPVRDPGRLALLMTGDDYQNWKMPVWEQIRNQTNLFAGGVAAWEWESFDLADRGASQPVSGYVVSGGFFDVLGVTAACVNVANLLLGRGDARRHELAISIALGATRGRLVRQLMVESLVLSSTGALAGVVLAVWAAPLLVRQFSTFTRDVFVPLPIDWRMLAIAGGVAVLTAIVFGAAPALHATNVRPTSALADSARVVHRASGRAGSILVACQISLSLVLTISAALLVSTFIRLNRHDLGFDPGAVLVLDFTEATSKATTAHSRQILDAIDAVPDVAAAGFANVTPMMLRGRMIGTFTSPDAENPQAPHDVFAEDVSPGWLRAMGIPLLRGREYSWSDVNPTPDRAIGELGSVIIVNEALARQFFGGRDPLGLKLAQDARLFTIIGVTADAVYNTVRDGAPPTAYALSSGYGALFVRSATRRPDALAPRAIAAILAVDPDARVQTMPLADNVRATIARERVTAMIAGFFGVLALVLAAVGIYGVMAYAVSRRRAEIAVRRALGATVRDIAAQFLGRGARSLAAGGLIGVLVSLRATALLAPLLYGVGPRDIRTFAGAVGVLAIVTFAAAWIPARRATRIDPAAVLREG